MVSEVMNSSAKIMRNWSVYSVSDQVVKSYGLIASTKAKAFSGGPYYSDKS